MQCLEKALWTRPCLAQIKYRIEPWWLEIYFTYSMYGSSFASEAVIAEIVCTEGCAQQDLLNSLYMGTSVVVVYSIHIQQVWTMHAPSNAISVETIPPYHFYSKPYLTCKEDRRYSTVLFFVFTVSPFWATLKYGIYCKPELWVHPPMSRAISHLFPKNICWPQKVSSCT